MSSIERNGNVGGDRPRFGVRGDVAVRSFHFASRIAAVNVEGDLLGAGARNLPAPQVAPARHLAKAPRGVRRDRGLEEHQSGCATPWAGQALQR